MKNQYSKLIWMFIFAAMNLSAQQPADRIYVGEQVCRQCHHQQGNRDQFNIWRQSKHAQAHSVLFKPESKEIAELSGIDIEPWESPICLGCHTTAYNVEEWERDDTFRFEDGVQCELCHGPGSDYIDADIMRDRDKAIRAGLKKTQKRDCMICHKEKNSHVSVLNSKIFDFDSAFAAIAHFGKGGALTPGIIPIDDDYVERTKPVIKSSASKKQNVNEKKVVYKTPFNLAVTRDGERLFIACEASNSLIVVDTGTDKILREIDIGMQPHFVCFSPDQSRAYVSNRASDNISVVDTRSYQVINTIIVGDEPHEMVITPDGKFMYVANAGTYDVSVVDLAKGHEVKRLAASRGPWGAAISPDGSSVYITNNLPRYGKFRSTSVSEVTVIDTKTATVRKRIPVRDANLIQGVAVSPDAHFALVTLIRTKNLVPMTRNIQGWIMTNGIGILWKDGRVDQLLLDEINDFFADPTDIVFSGDGRYAFATGGGVQEVAMIDIEAMKNILSQNLSAKDRAEMANHLGMSLQFVVERIKVGQSPRGMAVSPNNKFLYVADGLDDAISVIDIESRRTD